MSNSAISVVYIQGSQGPIGPIGPTGPCGPSGPTGNSKGPTGAVGRYYIGFGACGGDITLFFSDGSFTTVNGNFKGATTEDRSSLAITASNGIGATIFGSYNGGTFNLKGITASGSLYVSVTGPSGEYISIDTIYWGKDKFGNFVPSTMTPNKLVYLNDPYTIHGASLGFSTSNANQGWVNPLNFDGGYHLNTGSKILTVGPIRKGYPSGLTGSNIDPEGPVTYDGIFLDTNVAGVFILKTPIGITGITGTFRAGEIASITIMVESDDVWAFPQNIYFEPDENYLSCGKNIIGLFTYDGGNNWIANVSHRGQGLQNVNRQCIPGSLYGSCCITNVDGTLECLDYVTRSLCDRRFGTFNPATPCEISCGSSNGVCCSGDGNCQENISAALCETFGGKYWPNVNCNDYSNTGKNYEEPIELGRFCYQPCAEDGIEVFCCKNGRCLGKYSRIQCEQFLGGKSITAPKDSTCNDINCCDTEGVPGACCKCTRNSATEPVEPDCIGTFKPADCATRGGVYMGPNTKCNEVSCGCVCALNVQGACCIPDSSLPGGTTCAIKTEDECSALNGTFMGQDVGCECVSCIAEEIDGITYAAGVPGDGPGCSPTGSCCLGTDCLNTSLASCFSLGGAFFIGITCGASGSNVCGATCGDSPPPPGFNPCDCDPATRPAWCSRTTQIGVLTGCCCKRFSGKYQIGVETRSCSGGRFYPGRGCNASNCPPCTEGRSLNSPGCESTTPINPCSTGLCNLCGNSPSCRNTWIRPSFGCCSGDVIICDAAAQAAFCGGGGGGGGGGEQPDPDTDGGTDDCICSVPDPPGGCWSASTGQQVPCICPPGACIRVPGSIGGGGFGFGFDGGIGQPCLGLDCGNPSPPRSLVLPDENYYQDLDGNLLNYTSDEDIVLSSYHGRNAPVDNRWRDGQTQNDFFYPAREINAKIKVGKETICIPIICRSNCSNYELCEDSP